MKPVMRFAFVLAVVLVSATVALDAQTTVKLTPGAAWQEFLWTSLGQVSTTFTLNTTGATDVTDLRMVDAFVGGDMFRVDITQPGPNLVLYSSLVPLTTKPSLLPDYYPAQVWFDADAAWQLEQYYSRVLISLPPNQKYTITVTVLRDSVDGDSGLPITSGRAYIRASCGGKVGCVEQPLRTTSIIRSAAGAFMPMSTTSSSDKSATVRINANGGLR